MEKLEKFKNCFRSFRFTIKGKKIGFSDSWNKYKNFENDMFDSYELGLRLFRIDKSKIFSKDNCKWVTNEEFNLYQKSTKAIKLEYNNEVLTLEEWSNKLELSLNGIRLRYVRCKNYTTKEILFGKQKQEKKKFVCSKTLDKISLNHKASKMISSYRIKDLRSFNIDFKLDRSWFIENILTKNCFYCSDSENIGCDRIDNSKPHYIENVVPCCYICNTARNNHFTVDEFKLIGKAIQIIKNNRKNGII